MLSAWLASLLTAPHPERRRVQAAGRKTFSAPSVPFATGARFQASPERTPPALHGTAPHITRNQGQRTGRKRSRNTLKPFLGAPTKAELLTSLPPHVPPQCPTAPCARQAPARSEQAAGPIHVPRAFLPPSQPHNHAAGLQATRRSAFPAPGIPGSRHPRSGTQPRRAPCAPLPARGTGCVKHQEPKDQLSFPPADPGRW